MMMWTQSAFKSVANSLAKDMYSADIDFSGGGNTEQLVLDDHIW